MKSLILAIVAAVVPLQAFSADTGVDEAALVAQREQANQLRDEAHALRGQAEAARARDDKDCMAKILVNACRDSIREHYLAEIKIARDKEIEANRIDSAAKAELTRIRETQRSKERASQSMPRENGVKPLRSASSAPATTEPTATTGSERTAPPAAISKEREAAFESEKKQRQQDAELARSKEAEQAKLRAAKAKADAERYDARAKAVAERKAKRAAKAEGQAASAAKP